MKFIISFLFFFTHFALLAQDIPDFSANYLVKLNGFQAGDLKRSLSTDEKGLRLFKSTTQAKGVFAFFKPDLVEETSSWEIYNNRIRPHSYVYQRTGGKKDKYLTLNFDWQENKLNLDNRKRSWAVDIKNHTLDKLVYQLSLMRDLTNSSDIKRLSYTIADGKKLKTYDIDVLGTEVITTPLGKIDTVKLLRHRAKSKDRQTTLWCAPALGYLPVQLEHIEKDGSVFIAILRRLKGFDTDTAFKSLSSHPSELTIPITP